jgi:hypothetical protein
MSYESYHILVFIKELESFLSESVLVTSKQFQTVSLNMSLPYEAEEI